MFAFEELLFSDRVALAKQGDNALGSIRPSVRLSVRPFLGMCVCPSELSYLNCLTYDLDICYVG